MDGNDMEKYNLGYKVWTAMIWRNIILGIKYVRQ